MKRLISILALVLITSCVSSIKVPIINKLVAGNGKCSYIDKNNVIFIAPCDCFEVGDIPDKKEIKDE